MSGNSAFQMVSERGWRHGLRNLLGNEFERWWGTSRWWRQSLLWAGIVGFMLAAVLLGGESVENGYLVYGVFAVMVPSVAVIIMMQGVIVGEKENGTAAWVLSKPVSRAAFIIPKFVANALGALVCMTLIPGAAAYALLSYGGGRLLDPLTYLAALGAVWLAQLFFLALTLMLGTLFKTRGPVIGLALALLLLQQYIVGLLPPLRYALPWTLAIPLNNQTDALVPNLLQGHPVNASLQLMIIIAEVLIFVAVGVWRFEKEEF
jgi:ABC-2 type transport system permease protein